MAGVERATKVCPFQNACPIRTGWHDTFPIGTNGDKKMKDSDCPMRVIINSALYTKEAEDFFGGVAATLTRNLK